MIYTTDTTARALYDAMLAAANEPREDYTPVEFKHVRMRLTVLHKNLRATAAKVLKNWQAFGGGQKPKAEKTRAVTWPAGALSVFRAAMQDGDMAGAVRIGREKLCLRAYQFKDGPMLALCPVPVPDIGEGFALLLLENGFYSVTDTRTGLKVGNSYKTRARTLESAAAEKIRATDENWAKAMQKLASTPTAPDVLADWCALHNVDLEATAPEVPVKPAKEKPAPEIKPRAEPVTYTIATKTAAPDARSVATVIAEVRHIDLTAPKPEKQAKETPPAPAKRCQHADPIQARASARKRQLQRALAGQLAPHLVANLERCGLMRDGQATRKGRFLYLDDATI